MESDKKEDKLDILVKEIIEILDTPFDNWQVDEIKRLIAEHIQTERKFSL